MCNKCGGTGTIESFDTVEFWGYRCSMPSYELCDCLAGLKCPSCDVDLTMALTYDGEDEVDYYFCPECKRSWSAELEEYTKKGLL